MPHLLRDLWSTVSSDPVTLAAALMMAAAVLALLLIATPSVERSARQQAPRRPARARSLAADGAPVTEIARRTGLSHDAVALVLGAAARADTGKGRPVSAPFSALTARSERQPRSARMPLTR